MDKLVLVFLEAWNGLFILLVFLFLHGADDSLILLKPDMKNGFNEYICSAFFYCIFQRFQPGGIVSQLKCVLGGKEWLLFVEYNQQ